MHEIQVKLHLFFVPLFPTMRDCGAFPFLLLTLRYRFESAHTFVKGETISLSLEHKIAVTLEKYGIRSAILCNGQFRY